MLIRTVFPALIAACLALSGPAGHAAGPQAATVHLQIPAQPLRQALSEFGRQSGLQVVFLLTDVAESLMSPPLTGEFSNTVALERLLANTELNYEFLNARLVAIRNPKAQGDAAAEKTSRLIEDSGQLHLAQADAPASPPQQDSAQELKGVPEILVKGSRALNMDIRRTSDDVQPYVIFEREDLQRSGAANLEDFLRNRLTQNSQPRTYNQSPMAAGNTSQINLRGLGANQTLVLIDGRRVAGVNFGSAYVYGQPDINGIALSAIERIEILPTTASGIYGGNATGGVVNIIMRRDYSGIEVELLYGNSFASDTATRRADISGGFSLEGGRTRLMLTGSVSDQNALLLGERDFTPRAYRNILNNDSSWFYNPYSAGPLASTTNIVGYDPDTFEHVDLTLKDGNVPLNSPFAHVPASYTGVASAGGAAFLGTAGRFNFDIPDSAQAGGARQGLLPQTRVQSIGVTARRDFSPRLELFMEVSANRNAADNDYNLAYIGSNYVVDASAPNNPFNEAVIVTFPIPEADASYHSVSQSRRITGGAVMRLPREWTAGADLTWSRSIFDYTEPLSIEGLAAAVADGSIDVLRDTRIDGLDLTDYVVPGVVSSPIRNTMTDMSVRLAGPVLSTRAGQWTLAALLEHRKEYLSDSDYFNPDGTQTRQPSRAQKVDSAYLEARIPLISHLRAVQSLELQLAGRLDDYSIEGATAYVSPGDPVLRIENRQHSFNPTAGLRWQIDANLTMRASYGTGFRPPYAGELIPQPPQITDLSYLPDPGRGGTPLGVAINSFNTAAILNPERSKTWSAGLIFTPRPVSGLRLSVDYTRITKTDEIQYLGYDTILNNEAYLSGLVVRGANLPGDESGWAGPVEAIYNGPFNLADAKLEAYDAAVDFTLNTRAHGAVEFFARASWQTHYLRRISPDAPEVENVDQWPLGPLGFRANGGVSWSMGGWTAGWIATYFPSYRFADEYQSYYSPAQGSSGVPAQMYHDAYVSYRFDAVTAPAPLAGMQVQLKIGNVFNTAPPFDVSFAYPPVFYSSLGSPMLSTYALSLKRSF